MFERETNREKNLEKAIKEAKIKARKEASKGDAVKDPITEEDLARIESEFMDNTKPEAGEEGGGYENDAADVAADAAAPAEEQQ